MAMSSECKATLSRNFADGLADWVKWYLVIVTDGYDPANISNKM